MDDLPGPIKQQKALVGVDVLEVSRSQSSGKTVKAKLLEGVRLKVKESNGLAQESLAPPSISAVCLPLLGGPKVFLSPPIFASQLISVLWFT